MITENNTSINGGDSQSAMVETIQTSSIKRNNLSRETNEGYADKRRTSDFATSFSRLKRVLRIRSATIL